MYKCRDKQAISSLWWKESHRLFTLSFPQLAKLLMRAALDDSRADFGSEGVSSTICGMRMTLCWSRVQRLQECMVPQAIQAWRQTWERPKLWWFAMVHHQWEARWMEILSRMSPRSCTRFNAETLRDEEMKTRLALARERSGKLAKQGNKPST